jgi:tetratricopeptide (TPR) repeat protein
MSVTTDYFRSGIRAGHSGMSGIGKEAAKWGNVALGAIALAFYLVLAGIAQVPWPVLVGPFVLIGIARLMGLRSIWRAPSSSAGTRNGRSEATLLGRVLRRVDAPDGGSRNEMESLESRVDEDQPQRVIARLEADLGKTGKEYARNAYVIGRQYMRLDQYEEAREWLRRAQRQSSARSVLRTNLQSQQDACNRRLLAQGDDRFAAGDFHGARERYARLSLGLAPEEGGRLAVFLRSACAYSMLRDYEDARQAVLQSLKTDEETDEALALLDLLHEVRDEETGGEGARDVMGRIDEQIADHVLRLMDGLRSKCLGSEGACAR